MSTKRIDLVNKQIANWTVLFVKLHNYHWYVQGTDFFTLHEKFEELYDEAAVHIDVLAERLLALKAQPVATMRECLEIATIKEAAGHETAAAMVQAIQSDFSTMIDELKEGIQLAEEENDEGTGDMLLSIQQDLEKHVWMFQAFLSK